MAFYKFNLLVSHSYLCHRLDAKWIIWDLVLSSWLLEWTSGMILHLTHLYFPSAFMADREVSSSYNQSRTTTRIFAVSLPFFYYWKHCLPLFQNPSISSAPPPHQNHSLGEQWPPQTKCTWSFQPLLLPEDVQHSALKTIDHTLFLRCLIPNSCLFQPLRRFFSGFFVDCSSSTQPQMLEPFSIYSWFLHFLPPLSLFLPLLPPPPRLSGLMIPMIFNAYMLTVSKVIPSAQCSLLNCRPSCLSHSDVSHAFHIQYVPNWTSGLATRYPPAPKCECPSCECFHFWPRHCQMCALDSSLMTPVPHVNASFSSKS